MVFVLSINPAPLPSSILKASDKISWLPSTFTASTSLSWNTLVPSIERVADPAVLSAEVIALNCASKIEFLFSFKK